MKAGCPLRWMAPLFIASVPLTMVAPGRAQTPSDNLCASARMALSDDRTPISAPKELIFNGRRSVCSASNDGTAWSCQMGSLSACRPRNSGGSDADPAPLLALYDRAVEALKACLPNYSNKPYESREAIIEVYTQLTQGTEFVLNNQGEGPPRRLLQLARIARLEYIGDQVCRSLSVEIRAK